jgi:hypothetical protein
MTVRPLTFMPLGAIPRKNTPTNFTLIAIGGINKSQIKDYNN